MRRLLSMILIVAIFMGTINMCAAESASSTKTPVSDFSYANSDQEAAILEFLAYIEQFDSKEITSMLEYLASVEQFDSNSAAIILEYLDSVGQSDSKVAASLLEYLANVGQSDSNATASETSQEDMQPSDLEQLTNVTNIYPFQNGYACVETGYSSLHYIDEEGNEVFDVGLESLTNALMGEYYCEPFMPINDILLGHVDSDFKLVDVNGNILWELKDKDYSAIGAPQEGLIMVQGEYKTLSGNSPYVAYYDLSGKEVMRFDGKTHVGSESNFSNGFAFICEISESGEYDGLGSGWPVNWTMIDTSGNSIDLRISNPEIVQSMIAEYDPNDADEKVRSFYISEIAPFSENSTYTAAIVTFVYGNLAGKIGVLASVSNTGVVTLHSSELVGASMCHNNKCLIGGTIIFDLESGTYFDLKSLPALSGAKASEMWFMDDGNVYARLMNDEYDYYYCILTTDGEVLEGPNLLETDVRLPIYSNQKKIKTGYTNGKYYSWQSFDAYFNGSSVPVLSRNQLYPIGIPDNNGYGYGDIYGNIVINAGFTAAGNFSNGFAIVCTDKGRYYSFANHVFDNPAFINSNGEIVRRVSTKVANDSTGNDTSVPSYIPENDQLTAALGNTNEEQIETPYLKVDAGQVDSNVSDYETGLENCNLSLIDWNLGRDIDKVLSVSPDCKKVLAAYENGDFVICNIETGERVDVWFDADNSVPDEYGSIARLLEKSAAKYIGLFPGDVSWSPDGRYISLASYYGAMEYFHFGQGIWILDVESGALRAYSTFSGDLSGKDELAVIYRSVFSDSGAYLLTEYYGKTSYPEIVNLENGGSYMPEGQASVIDIDGRRVAAKWIESISDTCFVEGLVSARETDNRVLVSHELDDGGWRKKEFSLDALSSDTYVSTEKIESAGNVCMILYQLRTGAADPSFAIAFANCDADFDGYDELFTLKDGKLCKVDFDELNEQAAYIKENKDSFGKSSTILGLYNATLSPDGTHALLLGYDAGEIVVYLLNIEEMSLSPVTHKLTGYYSHQEYVRMHWGNDNCLYISKNDASLYKYAFMFSGQKAQAEEGENAASDYAPYVCEHAEYTCAWVNGKSKTISITDNKDGKSHIHVYTAKATCSNCQADLGMIQETNLTEEHRVKDGKSYYQQVEGGHRKVTPRVCSCGYKEDPVFTDYGKHDIVEEIEYTRYEYRDDDEHNVVQRYRNVCSVCPYEGKWDFKKTLEKHAGIRDEQNKSTRRALIIGSPPYQGITEMITQSHKAEAKKMTDFLINNEIVDSKDDVTTYEEGTKADLINGLRLTFKDTDEDDVSIIYINAHGDFFDWDGDGKNESGITLITREEFTKNQYTEVSKTVAVTDKELLRYIKMYTKGKVILIMNACKAGNFATVFGNDEECDRFIVITATTVSDYGYSWDWFDYNYFGSALRDAISDYPDSDITTICEATQRNLEATIRNFPGEYFHYDGWAPASDTKLFDVPTYCSKCEKMYQP